MTSFNPNKLLLFLQVIGIVIVLINVAVLLVFLREIVREIRLNALDVPAEVNDADANVQIEMSELHEGRLTGEESISTSKCSVPTYEGKAKKVVVLEI